MAAGRETGSTGAESIAPPAGTAASAAGATPGPAAETGPTDAELAAAAAGAASDETIIIRERSEASQHQQSAEAVTVVETDRAKRETADLGEVLARIQGVGVRRGGGLGATTELSLAGLTDDQVRVFLDGLPLDLMGYPFGIANVPVNLVDRIEIYSGVLPIRFGADALGGGVNLVTDQGVGTSHGGVSYEVGSFRTDRVTLSGRIHHAASGAFARLDGFFDHARNDYPVDVDVPDEMGRLSPTRVRLFHAGYLAAGGAAEIGVVDRPWAKRLSLRGFASGFDKQYQSNQTMTRVYGDVDYGERSGGATARYEQPLGHGAALDAVAGYAFTRGQFRDVSPCVFDWFGRCILEGDPGEIDTVPHDQRSWQHTVYARLYASWTLVPQHALRVSVAPTYATRSGNEHEATLPNGRDPLSAERQLATMVSGIEYKLDVLEGRLENVAFVKHYLQRQASEDPQPGGSFLRADRHTQRAGVGNGLRYRFTEWLYAKLSYEWATRVPRPDEVFGDNTFVAPNLALAPETSHNLNLGISVDDAQTTAGTFDATATGFLREIDNLISPFGTNDVSYQNVSGARSLGVDAAVRWTSPGSYLTVHGNASYQDFRNDSAAGAFGSFVGDRIPNHPYLFAAGSVRFMLRDRILAHDEISVSASSRYVHSFFRGWESVGLRDQKQVIPSQLVHTLGVGYLVRGDHVHVSTTLEVSNLTDEPAFDFYGLQRPGRAFYLKTALDF